jgi:hypothetical protein
MNSDFNDLIGITISVKVISHRRGPYTVTGELKRVTWKHIILASVRTGYLHRISLDSILSVTEIEPEFKILNFLKDGMEQPYAPKRK